jgi:hypothetical protein
MKYSYGSGSGDGLAVIWTGIPALIAQIHPLDGCNQAI